MKKPISCPNCSGRGIIVAEYLNSQTSAVCPGCNGLGMQYVPMTNADRIRSMSDEELARFLAEVENRRSAAGGGAIWKGAAHAKEWLKQPYKEDT